MCLDTLRSLVGSRLAQLGSGQNGAYLLSCWANEVSSSCDKSSKSSILNGCYPFDSSAGLSNSERNLVGTSGECCEGQQLLGALSCLVAAPAPAAPKASAHRMKGNQLGIYRHSPPRPPPRTGLLCLPTCQITADA